MSVSGIFSSSLNSSDSLQNTIRKEFRQLGQDLQSGNLSAAQQDFKTIQQDFTNQAAQRQSNQASGSGSNAVRQLFEQLGHELQSGNLSSAQQTFISLQQEFSQSTTSTSSSNRLSITA
jgi:outer membrane protein assembly factor BamD (BamD/ComL family)